jgi:4-hydroxybenzoate polyprenyltransferase
LSGPILGALGAIFRLARVHQWVKNALVWTALLTAHRYQEQHAVQQTLLAFLAFCAAASAVYALNDWLDVWADRAHPSKSHRPLASGALPLWAGPCLALFWACIALGLALLLGARFQLILLIYGLSSLAYCLGLKRLVLLDVMLLAGLYVLRIAGGAAAIDVPLSFWLAAFALFLFFSLALLKRVVELRDLAQGHVAHSQRAYQSSDLHLLTSLGAAAVIGASVVLVLYLNSPDVRAFYSHPARLALLLPIILYAMSRLWLIALRGQMHADPVVHALRDPISYVSVFATLAVVLWAI